MFRELKMCPSSSKKRSIVCQTVWSIFGKLTVHPVKNRLKRSGLSSGLPIPQVRDTTPLLNYSTNNLVLLSFCGRKGEHWLCSRLLSFSHGRLPRWKKGRTESTSPGSYYDYTFSHHYLFLQSTMSLQQRKMQHFSVQWRKELVFQQVIKYNCRSLEAEMMSIYNNINNLISAPKS